MGAPVKYDWAKLYKASEIAFKADTQLTLQEWCSQNNVNYSNCSRHFTDIRKALTTRILQGFAPDAARTIGTLLNSDDEGIQIKASQAILDRTGHSPQSTLINVNTGNQVLVAPMFAGEYKEDFAEMLNSKEENVIDEQ